MEQNLIRLSDSYYMGQRGNEIGIFKRTEKGYWLEASEEIVNTRVLPKSIDFLVEAPSFSLGFTKRVIQAIILKYQILADSINLNVNIPVLLFDKPYSDLGWFYSSIFRDKSIFTMDIFGEALEEMIHYRPLTLKPEASSYFTDGYLVYVRASEIHGIVSTFEYGYNNAFYDILIQMMLHYYVEGCLTLEMLVNMEQELSPLLNYLKRDYTLAFLEDEGSNEELEAISTISELIKKKESVTIDKLLELLHNEELIITEETEDGEFVLTVSLTIFQYMFSPTGLATLLSEFDKIVVASVDAIYEVIPTDKKVNTLIHWDDFSGMIKLCSSSAYGLTVTDDSGVRFKIKVIKR